MKLNYKTSDILFWIVIIIILLAGLYFRLKGLGKWPLAVDEYYIVKSTQNIIKHGIPEWNVGGYYVRGLLQQYLTALLLLVGLKVEFASRIIPLIANLAAVPALYMLGKKVSSRFFATALIFVFTFAIWEIEFARFGRMYTMFQAVFVWYLYFFYKIIIEDDAKSIKWLWSLSLLSVFVYEGSIFLVLLNFLPILWDKDKSNFNLFLNDRNRKRAINIFIGVAILFFTYLFMTFDFRTLNQQNIFPADVLSYLETQKSSGMLRFPILFINTFPSNYFWFGLFAIPLAVTLYLVYVLLKSNLTSLTKVSIIFIIIFSLLNLLGLAIVSFYAFLLLGWIETKDINKKLIKSYAIVFTVNIIYWIGFAVSTNTWYEFFPKQEISTSFSAVKILMKESLNYPYFYETYVLFRDTIPIATIIYLFLISVLIIYTIKQNSIVDLLKLRLLLLILLILIFVQNILNLTYFDTRYFFFLYPLVLLLALLGLQKIIRIAVKKNYLINFGFGLSLIVILILSEDFELQHMVHIDSPEVNFRSNYNLPLTIHYYPRSDSRTPAEVVNNEASSDDIIITNEHTSEYYLKKLDYFFSDYKGVEFRSESALNGTKERWTNANLIYKYSDLNNMIDNRTRNVWLIINTMWALDELNYIVEKYKKYIHFKGIDGRILVYKIPTQAVNGVKL